MFSYGNYVQEQHDLHKKADKCLYLKNEVNSNLVSIYYCKMDYSKCLHEGPKKNGGKMPPLCWQLDTTKIYITKSLITMNNILYPTNSKTYVKEPQNDGSLLVLWTHAITQWCNAIPTPQHKSKPTMVSVTPKNTWFNKVLLYWRYFASLLALHNIKVLQ